MNAARRMLVVSLIGLYAVAYTPAVEFFKMPVLLAHYQEHRQENASISLLGFLKLHYFSGHDGNTDVNKHQQLPFKTGECTLASLSVPALPLTERCMPDVPAVINVPVIFAEHSDDFSSSYLSCIWQPPRA